MASQQMLQIGIALIMLGFAVVFLSMLFGREKGKGEAKVAFFGLLGPIPFGFGNDKKLFLFAVAAAAAIFIASSIILRSKAN